MLTVHIIEGFKALIDDVLNYILCEGLIESSLQDICEAARVKIFDEDPKTVLEIVPIVVFDNILMVTDGHESNLISDGLLMRGHAWLILRRLATSLFMH